MIFQYIIFVSLFSFEMLFGILHKVTSPQEVKDSNIIYVRFLCALFFFKYFVLFVAIISVRWELNSFGNYCIFDLGSSFFWHFYVPALMVIWFNIECPEISIQTINHWSIFIKPFIKKTFERSPVLLCHLLLTTYTNKQWAVARFVLYNKNMFKLMK